MDVLQIRFIKENANAKARIARSTPRRAKLSSWLTLLLCGFAVAFFCRPIHADTPPSTQPVAHPNDDANRNIVLPTEPGDHKLKFRTHIGSQSVVMSYLLHLPANYNDGKKHPMLVFFHGIGECGTDLAGVYALGPMTLLREEGGNPTFAASCPMIVLCPQCPPQGQTWDTDYMYKACAELIAQTIKKTRTDPDRVYATGLSMGGLGSWCVAEQAPELFAAVAPLSAMQWQPDQALNRLRYISVWCVVGAQDQPRFVDGTHNMDNALSKGPLPQRFTYMVNMGHEAWAPPFQNPQFYEWMLAHHRLSAAEKKKLDLTPPATPEIPSTPGHYLLSFDSKVADQPMPIDYVLYVPKGYKKGDAPRPAILFLHEQDTIGPEFKGICMHGPDLLLEKKPALQNNFPFIVISPRLPIKFEWESDGIREMLLALVDHVAGQLSIDPDRVSVSGINAGAAGAWKLAADVPGRFCALTPILTSGSLTPDDDRKKAAIALPGRAYIKGSEHGSIDRITQIISQTKTDWRMAKLDDTVTALGDVPAFDDQQFLDWLSQQHRGTQPVSAAMK
jgi:predicted peptidase